LEPLILENIDLPFPPEFSEWISDICKIVRVLVSKNEEISKEYSAVGPTGFSNQFLVNQSQIFDTKKIPADYWEEISFIVEKFLEISKLIHQ
jgi:hypothetical protein